MVNIVKVKKDLSGQKFGRLTVIKQVEDYISPRGKHYAMWCCRCDCGNLCSVLGISLKWGNTQSCGCLLKEVAAQKGKNSKKYNRYDLSGDFGIGYTSNTNVEFYFDKSDYDLIKDYCWFENDQGYIATNQNKQHIMRLYRLIMGFPDNKDIDHMELLLVSGIL